MGGTTRPTDNGNDSKSKLCRQWARRRTHCTPLPNSQTGKPAAERTAPLRRLLDPRRRLRARHRRPALAVPEEEASFVLGRSALCCHGRHLLQTRMRTLVARRSCALRREGGAEEERGWRGDVPRAAFSAAAPAAAVPLPRRCPQSLPSPAERSRPSLLYSGWYRFRPTQLCPGSAAARLGGTADCPQPP